MLCGDGVGFELFEFECEVSGVGFLVVFCFIVDDDFEWYVKVVE